MDLNNIDLNKLRTFLVVHRSRSIRAAAEILHLTPSAISMATSSLERSLGLTLFTRTGRRIVPTASGDRLAAVATQFLARLGGAVAELRAAKGEVLGHLRLGVPAEFGAKIVVPRIAAFRARHPGVTFTVSLGDQSTLVPALVEGRHDLIICDDEPRLAQLPQLASLPLAREHIVLACSRVFRDRHLGRRANPGLTALAASDHVAYVEHQADLHKWYWHHFRKRPRLKTPLVANHPAAVLSAVQSHVGLGLLPAFLVKDGVDCGQLVVIETGRPPLVNEMSVVRLRDHVVTRAEREFLRSVEG